MGFWTRLWHRLLFGSSPLTAQPARPAACPPSAPTARQPLKPPPLRFHHRSREELELSLMMPWLRASERGRFLDRLLPNAWNHDPWTDDDIEEEPWQQVYQWTEPMLIHQPETMTIEGFCLLLEAEFSFGLSTFCTPLSLLSRPVRMLWLLHQGRRAEYVYAMMEQALGNRQQAIDYTWWVVTGL